MLHCTVLVLMLCRWTTRCTVAGSAHLSNSVRSRQCRKRGKPCSRLNSPQASARGLFRVTPSAHRCFPRIVGCMHVDELPRTGAMQLDDDVAFRPREMPHPRWNHAERSLGKLIELGGIELIPHADQQGSADHGHMLDDRVEMRRDGIPVRKRQPQGERAPLGGITIEDCKLGACG